MTKFNLKIIKLFDYRAKFQGLGIIVLMFIAGILETFSIGVIPAFIYLLNQPNLIETNVYLQWLFKLLPVNSNREFLIYLSLILILIFIFKNSYLTLLSYLQYRYIFPQQTNLSHRLFKGYLNLPYTFHLQQNPAKLISRLNMELNIAFRHVIIPLMTLTTELIMMTFVAILLMIVQPLISLIAVTLMLINMSLFYKLIHKKGRLLGKQSHYHHLKMIQEVNESLGGIKEITISLIFISHAISLIKRRFVPINALFTFC